MTRQTLLVVGAIGLLGACGTDSQDVRGAAESSGKAVTYYDYNVNCANLGFAEELKVDEGEITNGVWGTFSKDGLEVKLFTSDGKHIDWEANLGIDAVIMKGGSGANVYVYDPESLGGTGLVTPINASGNPADISHVTFCFDWEVQVQKTAETSYHRDFSWQIDKQAGHDPFLLLALGQTYVMPYSVKVWSSFADRDWAVSGVITISNPSSEKSAILNSVSDVIEGFGSVPVDCSVSFPYVLAPSGELLCSYQTALPDAQGRLNTATVETAPQSAVGGNVATADVLFGEPASLTDSCVSVDDDKAGFLGVVCEDTTFEYSLNIGPYAVCGEHLFLNLAVFTAEDTQAQGWNSATVLVDVACPPAGCSLTPGYWKTHSEHGPAPYDDTWAKLPSGADTIFYLSGQSYHQVLWTAPAKNTYYILSHAFIAAVLNGLNGADVSEVDAELQAAAQIFETYTPAQIGSLRPKNPLRVQILSLAGVLDDYNNGIIGPGHCSE